MYVYDWMCNRREYKAEKLRQEGRQEGHQQGRQEGHQQGRQEGHQQGRQEGHQQGRQEREEELRQGIAQVFADDKDAMEKLDQFFNGHNGQK